MAEVIAVIGAIQTIVKLTSSICEYAKRVKNASRDREILVQELSVTSRLCQNLEAFGKESDNEDWAPTFMSLEGTEGPVEWFKQLLGFLNEELASSDKRRKRLGIALKWPFDKDDVAKIVQKVEYFKSSFTAALAKDNIKLSIATQRDIQVLRRDFSDLNIINHAALGEIQNMSSDVAKITRFQLSQEDKNLLANLSSIKFDAIHADIRVRRAENTGEWFLKDPIFKEWSEGSSGMLWCPGIPGSGKTVLSSLVVDSLKEASGAKSATIGIYCTYKKRRSTVDLIGSLVVQLAEGLPELPARLREKLYETRPMDLPTLTTFTVDLLRTYSTVNIVVDALDECADGISLLTELKSLLAPHGSPYPSHK
ncbi:hypothetical protein P7C71_g4101, partial [Lecanoromycetidae sp. Uapishka_2]